MFTEHVPSPSGCGTTLIWYSSVIDDDLFDAQILVEREEGLELDANAVARVLGIENATVRQLVHRGEIIAGHSVVDGITDVHMVWSSIEVAQMVLDARRPPCGSYRAMRHHQRHGEEVDDACRLAGNAHKRRYQAARQKVSA